MSVEVAQLTWTDPSGESRSLPLATEVVIGRGADNAIVLHDRRVSRRHATIVPTAAGACVLTDLGSSNGTQLNGQFLTGATELRSGDRIAIGATVLTFTGAPAADATPRVVAATLAPDGTTVVKLRQQDAGWLELPGGERRILGGETRIGRSARNDITVEDSQVSRNHAHIRRVEGRFVLSDLGSANGVKVNGEPVLTPRELADDDRIEIGNTVLRFSLAPFADGVEEPGTGEAVNGAIASATNLFSLAGGGAPAAIKGDLREVTVLFADLHGFTAMSERLNNPEQTTIIINQVFEMLTAEIVRFDGSIDKYAGDSIMALFGAPRAHEDDPERAIKAAMAMQRALEGFNRRLRRELGLNLQVRIGINTGEVLFGQVGGGAFRSYTVMGDTVNLASRLEHAARVGHILVGETTQRLAQQAFHFTMLPPMDIRGKREPVQAYEVLREKRADEVLHEPAGSDYLIGREQELRQMRAALDEAQAGQGRLLAIAGDAGIGKSQLLAAFRRTSGEPGAQTDTAVPLASTWIVERCLSYETTAPYALLAGLLRSLLEIDCDETIGRQRLLTALNALLPGVEKEQRAEYLALLGQVLGVKLPASATNAAIGGLEAKVRRKLMTAMVRALVTARIRPAEGHLRPLVLTIEEMQWADSASVDALDELIDALPGLPLLLLLTYRPEWSHDYAGRPFYRQIQLAELSPEHSRRFLRQLLRPAELPDAVADRIFAQCGGNPLLLEETVKALRERGALVSHEDRWALTADVSLLNIPSTLRSMMMARIDRLREQDRAVLQKAAVIGRTFTYRILATVTGSGGPADDALDDSLAALKEQEFIVENQLAAEPEFSFKHTIVQEIAYNNVLAAERRGLHEQIGDAIERISGTSQAPPADDQLEVLAHHYSRSGAKRKAVDYLMRSGERAGRLYANEAAIAQFEEALEKWRSLPADESAKDPTRAMRLHELLGDVRLLTADFRCAQESYEAGLAEGAGSPLDKARLWNQLGLVWERRGDYRKALGSYQQGIAVLRQGRGEGESRDPVALATLQASVARAQAHRGDYAEATTLAKTALAGVEHASSPDRQRVQAAAFHVLGLTDYAAGRPDDALDHHRRSLELRQELGDTMGMQESYNELGAIYWSRGQLDRAFTHLVSLTAVLRLNTSDLDPARIGGTREPASTAPLAEAPAPTADDDDGGKAAAIERYYRSGLAAAERVGDLWGVAVSGNRLGNLLYRQGEWPRALGYLRKAVTEAERIGAREVAAQASIGLGAILIGQGYAAAGLQHLERGIAGAEAVESVVVIAEGEIRLAEGLLASGDLDGARAAAGRGFTIAQRVGHHFTLGLAHRVLGRVSTASADWGAADQHCRLALDIFRGIDAQGEVGRTLGDFARLWRAWSAAGNGPLPEGATLMLQQAEQIFARLDMQTDLRAARSELSAIRSEQSSAVSGQSGRRAVGQSSEGT